MFQHKLVSLAMCVCKHGRGMGVGLGHPWNAHQCALSSTETGQSSNIVLPPPPPRARIAGLQRSRALCFCWQKREQQQTPHRAWATMGHILSGSNSPFLPPWGRPGLPKSHELRKDLKGCKGGDRKGIAIIPLKQKLSLKGKGPSAMVQHVLGRPKVPPWFNPRGPLQA